MAVKPIYEDYSFCEDCKVVKDVNVECKINSGDIKNIVAVTGNASAVSEEIVDDEIRYGGRVIFCVLYESESGDVKKTECGVEFFDKVEAPKGANLIKFVSYAVTDIQSNYINGSLIVTAVVKCELTILCKKNIPILVGGENLLCNSEEREISCLAGCSRSIIQIDEDFELPFTVKDIVSHRSTAYLSDVKSGIGVIILEGSVILSFTALQNNEKNDIVKEVKKIQFRQELELSSASPHMDAFANIEVSKSNFKVVVDEEKHTSTIVFSCDLDASGCVYECKNFKLTKDVYSVKNEITSSVEKIMYSAPISCFCANERIIGSTDVEVDKGAEVLAVVCERVEGLTFSQSMQSIVGTICASVVLKDANGRIYGKDACLPIETGFNGNVNKKYAIDAVIEGFNYRIRANVEFEVVLHICFTEYVNDEICIISNVDVGEEKEDKEFAISVYVARANDTLWDVCKRLGVSAETITELNPNVEFPLNGKERLIVYRNL